jgi:hypothetical protein
MIRRKRWYKLLPDHTIEPVAEPNAPMGGLMEWVEWCVEAGGDDKTFARVGYAAIGDDDNDVEVSTTFLGLDHRHAGDGPPLVFETAIIIGRRHEIQGRYSTWDDAVAGHREAIAMVLRRFS